MVNKRRIKAMDLFYNYWGKYEQILPRETFLDLWGNTESSKTYYYKVRDKFIDYLKEDFITVKEGFIITKEDVIIEKEGI